MALLDSQAAVGFITITIPALATIYATRKGNKRVDYIDEYIKELKKENEQLKKKRVQ